MGDEGTARILAVNSGSSSIKISVYRMGASEDRLLSGTVGRIGLKPSGLRIEEASGEVIADEQPSFSTHEEARDALLGRLEEHPLARDPDAVGHRIVHGGPELRGPTVVTPRVRETLEALSPLDPTHLHYEFEAVDAVGRFFPGVLQVACFDTAFHRSMPRVAQLYGLPRSFIDEGLIRYGFHGLSYEFVMGELPRIAGRPAADGRIIIAHLGNGASMAAVRGGNSIDTTMGFTPTSGLVMGTRCGDLDPAAILYLQRRKGMQVPELNEMVNLRSGLLGLSGTSSDMKDLLDRQQEDRRAAEAVELFCYRAKTHLGALAAALGGLDTLVFTGGIGEKAAEVRLRICEGLDFLGIRVSRERNEAHEPVISGDDSRVAVRVIETNEGLMIARHTYKLLKAKTE